MATTRTDESIVLTQQEADALRATLSRVLAIDESAFDSHYGDRCNASDALEEAAPRLHERRHLEEILRKLSAPAARKAA